MRDEPPDPARAYEKVVDVGMFGYRTFSDAVDRSDHSFSGSGSRIVGERDKRPLAIHHLLNSDADAEDSGVDSSPRAVKYRSDAEKRCGTG